MTEIRPLDAKPAGLALPEAIERQQRLNPEDWRITEVSMTQRAADLVTPESPFLTQVKVGLPKMSAILLPHNPEARQQLNHMTGYCFFLGPHLFRIYHASVSIAPAGELCGHDGIQVCIDAHAIWRQGSKSDLGKTLPTISLREGD